MKRVLNAFKDWMHRRVFASKKGKMRKRWQKVHGEDL
jgi:hypothetical protein